jgi:hypothetical protein
LVGCYLGYEIETSDIYEIRGKKWN